MRFQFYNFKTATLHMISERVRTVQRGSGGTGSATGAVAAEPAKQKNQNQRLNKVETEMISMKSQKKTTKLLTTILHAVEIGSVMRPGLLCNGAPQREERRIAQITAASKWPSDGAKSALFKMQ